MGAAFFSGVDDDESAAPFVNSSLSDLHHYATFHLTYPFFLFLTRKKDFGGFYEP